MFLTPDELQSLTGRKHADAQAASLHRMGLRFILDADGRPKVAKSAVESLLAIKTPVRKTSGPRLELVR